MDLKDIVCLCFLDKVGGEDSLELKIESIIEGCNYIWEGNQGMMCKNLEDQCLPPCINMKSLTEAVLITQSPCQARHVLIYYKFYIPNFVTMPCLKICYVVIGVCGALKMLTKFVNMSKTRENDITNI